MDASPGLEGYWVDDHARRLGPALPAIVRAAADARCQVSPGSSPMYVCNFVMKLNNNVEATGYIHNEQKGGGY